MITKYDSSLKAMVTMDEKQNVKEILHTQEYYASDEAVPKHAAFDYLKKMAARFKISQEQLKNVHKKADYFDPKLQAMELRIEQEKRFFDSVTLGIVQTINNIPVWRKGMTVTVKENPSRIIQSVNNTVPEFKAKLPAAKTIEKYRSVFEFINNRPVVRLISDEAKSDDSETGDLVRSFFAKANAEGSAKSVNYTAKSAPSRLIRGKFYYYKYDATRRQPLAHQPIRTDKKKAVVAEEHDHYTMPLPPVNRTIKNGEYYLVAEITFTWKFGNEMITWLALVEIETGSVLYIEPLAAGVNGLVFPQDPITSSGNTANSANLNNATLNPFRSSVVLPNLDAPDGMGVQHLSGSHVEVINVDGRAVAPPTQTGGANFDYDVRTNDFAAVSAYYHANNFFDTVESLGFSLATYFPGTTFPVDIDHADQSNVNAHCVGNGAFGIDHSGYGYGDDTNLVDPTIGRAVDKWVHWHEIGGHGILYGHVNTANFGFAHSAGDGLAGIQNDPTSQLRELGLTERFRYAPFRFVALDRWFNRDVTAGWAWGGVNDTNGYNSEQILATSNFRFYRSIGGDSNDLSRRRFASRMATYLILRAIATLTPATNPTNALGLCNALMAVDLLDWTSEGISGGAYNKVIRWAYEKQGLFQPAGAPTPVVSAGAPPAVDVYINDGRNGEYNYQPVHWHNISMWNRNAADGMTGHQDAIPAATNYMYVKIKNRGTQISSGVNVRGYHCLPGAGLTWPVDFTEMGPAGGLNVASVGPNNTEEITVGPFQWIPNENIYGHDCTLMILSTAGDPSNIDNFTMGDTIAEWRLVPNDNNIGQRNVHILPGGGGEAALTAGLHQRFFWAGNPFRKKATIELKTELPKFLKDGGWQIQFRQTDNKFELKPGEKRKIIIDVVKGNDFTADQAKKSADRDINVYVYGNGQLLGGMTYRIDPDKKEPGYIPGEKGKCKDKAQELLKCLNLGDAKVKNVCVKKVSLDIELNNDCSCG